MPQHDFEEFDSDLALKAHLNSVHPDWDYLAGNGQFTPGAMHYSLHRGEHSHRAIASHLIEGHGYSIQTVRLNPSPQLVIDHAKLHADEFAADNNSTWTHSHEPPKLWEPEIHAEDVVGRVVVIKTQAKDRWQWDQGLDELRQQGAMLVLFMDRYDSIETLRTEDMARAGWIKKDDLLKQIEHFANNYESAQAMEIALRDWLNDTEGTEQ